LQGLHTSEVTISSGGKSMESVINKNIKPEILEIDSFKFVIVDNFLTNPDDFRQYARELSTRPVRMDNALGYELHPSMDEFERRYPNFRRAIAYLVISTIGDSTCKVYNLDKTYTSVGIYKGPLFNCVYKLPSKAPHVDPGHISSFIYLNTDDLCSGGTGIYRHIPTGNMHFVQSDYNLEHLETKPLIEQLNYSAGDWELLHKFEMRYNRFIALTSSVVHKIFFEPEGHPFKEDFDHVRLSLNSFFIIARPGTV